MKSQIKAFPGTAIVIGHAGRSACHLSASQHSFYSDYEFIVDTLIKDNTNAPVDRSSGLVLTRPGGSFTLLDGQVKGSFQAFPLLAQKAQYLLFLRYLPQSLSYESIDEFSFLRETPQAWQIMTLLLSDKDLTTCDRARPQIQRPPALSQAGGLNQ